MDITANSQFNRMTSLSDDVYTLSWLEFGGLPSPGNLGAAIRLEEGSRIGNYYGKRFAGFTDEGQWLFYKADGSAVPPSQISDEDLRSEEHTSELQSRGHLVCRLLLA